MSRKVNLDAFIPREDFEVSESKLIGTKIDRLSIRDLAEDSFFYNLLRKPDFQRETNEWEPDKVKQFIQSFLDGELIPAIILWQSASGYIFIIDGSHRISALKAWLDDDFGDGKKSRLFYDGIIPDDQISVAESTRKLIRANLGSYEEYKLALSSPEKVKSDIVNKAKFLGTRSIQLQWVEGDAEKAENSFFKINQQAAPIDDTELKLLKARKYPNGIAARAIIRSGRGHKYWSMFQPDKRSEIELVAKEIHSILFNPPLKTPIKTLDVPLAGKINSSYSLPLVLEFINLVNNVDQKKIKMDVIGDDTITYLKNCRKVAQLLNSNHSSSLGLHPVVYFYSSDGRFKIASFYAITLLVKELEEKKKLKEFITVREPFEKILLENDNYIQQILRHYRSAKNAYPHIKNYLLKVIEFLLKRNDALKTMELILKEKDFDYLTVPVKEYAKTDSSDFSSATKSAVFITNALNGTLKCKICNGYLHSASISVDHIDRKEDGGKGEFNNAQLTHPFCNSAIKN